MTISRGKAWGESRPLPDDGVVVRTDAEASAVVAAARRAGDPVPALGLLGGDLCRTLGGTGDEGRLRSEQAMSLPIDLGAALIDGKLHWFVAHLVARRGWWRGRAFVAMNAAWLGDWNLGPRSHPNDGLLDTYDAKVALVDVAGVRRRVRSGSHLPHPGIAERRGSAIQLTLERSMPVYADGRPVGAARHLSLRLEPDALVVVV